jgi:hypothetical protein
VERRLPNRRRSSPQIDVLYRHCDAVGRDPGEIQKTTIMIIDPMADLDGFLRTAEQYATLGIDLFDIMLPEDTTDPVGIRQPSGRTGYTPGGPN